MEIAIASASAAGFTAFVADAAQSGDVSAVHLLGVLVTLGGGVIAYLARQVDQLRRSTAALQRRNIALITVLGEVSSAIPDDELRNRVRRELDQITNRKEPR